MARPRLRKVSNRPKLRTARGSTSKPTLKVTAGLASPSIINNNIVRPPDDDSFLFSNRSHFTFSDGTDFKFSSGG